VIDHLIFLFYIYFFLFSSIGYGIKFSNIISKNLVNLNLGWYGVIGFFLISLISLFTSFFVSHNFLHNFVLHIIGFIFFCSSLLKNRNYYEFRILIYLSLALLLGAYVFKNHDDFSYYHLTYTLNLSENSFIVGTGNFSHGFRTFSSLFYYHSTLYFPLIEYYLFHIGPFYILIFFNFIIVKRLIKKTKGNFNYLTHYYSLISLIFVNVVFYRLSEHGTDRSAQILLVLIFLIFLEILSINNQKKLLLSYVSLIAILIALAASMKAIYYLYFLLIPIIFFKKKIFLEILNKQNFTIISIILVSIILNLSIYYFNTGCFLYPAEQTCILKPEWSIPNEEVKLMSTHYEWWAKGGGGPGYVHDLKKEDSIQNFTWFQNWIDRHFFNKVFDTLLGIIFICLLVFLVFFYFRIQKKINVKYNYSLVYLILSIFLLEWFINHPSMRYGGFVLIGLPIIIFSSSMIARYEISKKNIYKLTIFFIILSLIVFNVRNVIRIDKEANIYGYNFLKSPFYFVEKVNSKIILTNEHIKIFNPDKSCWASKTPCSYNKNLKLKKFLWMNMVSRK
jgi:hypothetical protein